MRRDLAAMHPDATAGALQPPHPRPPPLLTMSATEPTTELVIPLTGEALSLDAPTERLGTHLLEIRELQAQLGDAKRTITNEIVNRLDHQAAWTQHLPGGITVKTQSPQPVEEFDELALRSELLELVDAGQLAVEAVDSAVEPVVTYKTRKAGINALRKLGGQVAEIVNRHAREVAKPRYVTVQRNGAK